MFGGLFALVAVATTAPDYAGRLRADAAAFRAEVTDSHPGLVNARDTQFRSRLDAAYAQALRRARTTRTYAQYSWALSELTSAFDDGHLGIMPDPKADADYPWAFSWPGFVTELAADGHRVSASEEGGVSAGALLVGCDGRSVDRLAADRIGRFMGSWSLASQRRAQAATLFLPPDNPWLGTIRRCTFEQGGVRRTVTLHWRPIEAAKRKQLLARSRERFHAPVALERLADGTVWVGLGSFDSDATSPDGRALDTLVGRIDADAGELRTAPRVVFDLRGNNGGSSAWINRLASSLWSKPFVDARRPDGGYAEWRVSPGNIERMQTYQTQAAARREIDPNFYNWATRTLGGMEGALRDHQALWTEPHGSRAPRPVAPPNPVASKVFVLTDYACASACLDAVDLLTALGGVQVGQDTNADTDYMEIRERKLADGTVIWVPMKVYRDRPRGSNVPAVAQHAWDGRMADTAGLQRWIATL
ncbi:hypothetical protein DM480_14190 [Sphingomonas sp. FARSPH]|jgi:Peptidase family S41|nr:S41 family peptidase [Sphingomonas sp. FARSPH]AXJ96465.1 hypothetical protein DM480_14190 [Sphingomonas sp. FARSPH]